MNTLPEDIHNKIDLDKYCRSILLSQLNNEEVKQFLTIIKSITIFSTN